MEGMGAKPKPNGEAEMCWMGNTKKMLWDHGQGCAKSGRHLREHLCGASSNGDDWCLCATRAMMPKEGFTLLQLSHAMEILLFKGKVEKEELKTGISEDASQKGLKDWGVKDQKDLNPKRSQYLLMDWILY